MKRLVYIFYLLFIPFFTSAQEIRIQGSVHFDLSKISIRPGEEFDLELESNDRINMDIKKLDKNSYWTVSVSKNDINWDNQVKIYVRRTSSGNGKGYVWGGWNYVQIGNLNSQFLNGYEKLNNIDLQYKIEGADLSLEAGDYYTNIVYTLYES